MYKNVCRKFEYKGYTAYVFYENPFHYTVICNGREICYSTSITKAEEKFKVLVDSGLKISCREV
jgi:hypothetical protein